MLKLSHPDYFLPTVHAVAFGEILQSGTTMPQLVVGICEQTGIKSDYVIKFIGAQRMSPEASARELIAALIAKELDFNVPEPVIIHISDEFVELMRGNDNYLVASNSLGFNFGNEYKTGYYSVIKDQTISSSLEDKLIELYAFDIFISNADRRIEKPNFLTNGDEIIIFDHELAFGFTMELSFLRNSEPWKIRSQDLNWINDNFCFNRLKGKQFDYSSFQSKLELIDNSFWDKIETILPPDWLTEQVDEIKKHLNTLMSRADIFTSELNRILL
ncbi:HipA family kinase [Mucilaginibacter sp. L196]|uniref:HipA family kinase n=1 Tax=Mucilaginibacter sp. L196 TaxID=1641870 RepID=UPI00131BAB16|nr:HipA family kinase [Mucilaginibacter sp. L196]